MLGYIGGLYGILQTFIDELLTIYNSMILNLVAISSLYKIKGDFNQDLTFQRITALLCISCKKSFCCFDDLKGEAWQHYRLLEEGSQKLDNDLDFVQIR